MSKPDEKPEFHIIRTMETHSFDSDITNPCLVHCDRTRKLFLRRQIPLEKANQEVELIRRVQFSPYFPALHPYTPMEEDASSGYIYTECFDNMTLKQLIQKYGDHGYVPEALAWETFEGMTKAIATLHTGFSGDPEVDWEVVDGESNEDDLGWQVILDDDKIWEPIFYRGLAERHIYFRRSEADDAYPQVLLPYLGCACLESKWKEEKEMEYLNGDYPFYPESSLPAFKRDIYTLGLVLMRMCKFYQREAVRSYSKELRDMCIACLWPQENQRPDAHELVRAIQVTRNELAHKLQRVPWKTIWGIREDQASASTSSTSSGSKPRPPRRRRVPDKTTHQ